MNDAKPEPLAFEIRTANTILYCDRFQETVRFYRDTLGFPVLLSKSWFVEFAINPLARLSVADSARSTLKSSGGQGLTLTFQVENVTSLHSRLSALNCSPTPMVSHTWNATLFHVHDPEGHRLEFWAPAEIKS